LDNTRLWKRFFLYVAPGPKSSGVNKDFSASQAVYVSTRLKGVIYAGPLPGLINVSETNQSVKEFDNQAWF